MKKLSFLVCLCISITVYSQKNFKNYKPLTNINPENIDIVRDSFGVPHIFAKTDAEVAYGLAWATSEDDVENSQFIICALRGYLGRKQGLDGVKVDYAVKMLGVTKYVEEHYKELPEDYKHLLKGYCDGANSYFLKYPEKGWFKKIFPVRPQDIVAGHMLAMALMGGVDGTINSIINGSIKNKVIGERPEGSGSNAFAFNSAKTLDGSAYLAVNAHQPIEGLLSWYEAHLCSEEGWNITGALFHGSPTIYLGSNEYLGWAHTTGQLDETDVYKLEMHPRKNLQYKFDGKWLKLEKYNAKLRVAVGKKKRITIPVPKKYWVSIYGPTLKTKHGVYSIRMPALMDVKPSLQWYRMNKATNFSEFKKALEIQGLSRQNITYADRRDTIYFLSNGLIPDRNKNYNWSKVLPGDTSATLWTKFLPIDSLANFLNPECGFVFNTNNAGFEATCETENGKLPQYHPHIGYENEFNNRSLRFYELMNEVYANKLITFEELKKIKFDSQFPKRITFKGKFWFDDFFKLNADDYPDIADAITRIKNFDLQADTADRNYPIMMFSIYKMLDAEHSEEGKGIKTDSVKRIAFYVSCVRKAKEHMLKHFGTLDISTGQTQVLERGGKAFGLNGAPDALRAVYCRFMDDGRLRMFVGDGYVQLTRFTKAGPEIYAISPYGASSDPKSPHYNDQMEMFSKEQMRKVSLKKDVVYKSAEKISHPN
ncbi:MAG: penicillin acylase family protein [Chitinophagales bacterium]|nr:penicillin acylase family protein [Chitinophagales bacterium]